MTSITIPLSDDRIAKLNSLAHEAGLSPEELVRARVELWLSQPDDDFLRATQHVLQKNTELYRQLA